MNEDLKLSGDKREGQSAPVRVRFAPSPTGFLHLGGARTALYNFLFARHNEGTFVLRIEDTDVERSTEEAVEAIINSMKWLGLEADEGPGIGGDFGPYRQSERYEIYKHFIDVISESGEVYKCYCTPEELRGRREAALREKRPPRYDRRCLRLTPKEISAFENEGRKPALRILSPDEGKTSFTDLIRGKIEVENENLDDYVILRSDGTVTYNFAVVIDDSQMEISHVIRGDDHLSNTPRQIVLYRLLGLEEPKFAHLPMILGPDGARLSKRHGATRVEEYREEGYLPEAMVNFLALLGWSLDERTNIFTLDSLIENFTLERVSKNPATLDRDKLDWLNGYYIRILEIDDFSDRLIPFWIKSGLLKEEEAVRKRSWLNSISEICQERLKRLSEITDLTSFLFKEEIEIDPKDKVEILGLPDAGPIILKAKGSLEGTEPFESAQIETALRKASDEFGLKPRKFLQPVRVAVTGKKISPPLFESIELLGKERTIRRLEKVLRDE